jgi:DNA-binding response OmpR family regulator
MKILLIEDEPDLLESVSDNLKKQGYICELAANATQAKDKLENFTYDFILLDVTLPDGNGLELIQNIKEHQSPDTRILIVSARASLDDKLSGLDLGADDYITKPFHMAELMSRINAIVRRTNFAGKSEVSFKEIKVNMTACEVWVKDTQISLTRKEYELLLYFIVNKNRLVTKEALAEHLWGDHMEMANNFDFVYTHVKNLRKKIMSARGEDYLKTVYGMGYKFTE